MPHEALPDESESLALRYSRLALEGGRRRRVDIVLRGFDITIAGLTLLVLSPVAALIAATVLATSGLPLLYSGERVGRYGEIFRMRKFRTLRPDAETRLGPYYGAELDARTPAELTRFGRWLRASQLDEVPQLWNVLVGDMSIVGPRPIRPRFFEELCEELPMYWQRLVVRPGLTGFAQTRMGREPSWAEKLAHDLEWIADRSAGLYLRIVAATAWRVLRQSASAFVRRPPTGGRALSPTTYDREIRVDVEKYDALQDRLVEATRDVAAVRILDLGTGTGETALRLLEAHPRARLVALDASAGMLAVARGKLPAARVESWHEQRLEDPPLPSGPYDMVVSALAVHHLDAAGKADLFRRAAAELRPGGRLVLADVVVPDRSEDAVTPLTPAYDQPDSADDLLAWLAQAGFAARVTWAHRDLAVIAADRL